MPRERGTGGGEGGVSIMMCVCVWDWGGGAGGGGYAVRASGRPPGPPGTTNPPYPDGLAILHPMRPRYKVHLTSLLLIIASAPLD
jgi:hypothetical protein